MKNKFYFGLLIALLTAFSACSDEKAKEVVGRYAPDHDGLINKMKEGTSDQPFPEEAVYDIINKIPSPLETSKLIKESGAIYNESMLNDVNHSKDYSNKFTQAINLGVYSSNLGYINMYSNYNASLNYLGSIKDLAEELHVSQFFDFTTIRRLATNNENIDSILQISTAGFEKMNQFLKSEGRDEISVLIVVGGWIESLHILTEVAEKSPTPAIIERIGEQKMFLADLATIVGLYENFGYFNQIVQDIEELKIAYEDVTIKIVPGKDITTVKDGVLVIESTSMSQADVSNESLKQITNTVRKIRSIIISTDEK